MQVLSVVLFLIIVGLVLALSFYFARKAKSASGYYAAGGTIHWSVNGVAFAGDYLSAASFLGICGLIATHGYDGFLYSIGFLAGWIVALFIVAEPMKKLGKYTFADAIDAKFNSRGIKLSAAISALVVSVCYLIPQMVGAGALVTPLLGLPHHIGVIIVGLIVITIVATAGMTSTTYVQFIKGGLLVVFSLVLVIVTLTRGLTTTPDQGGEVAFYDYRDIPVEQSGDTLSLSAPGYRVVDIREVGEIVFARLAHDGIETWWRLDDELPAVGSSDAGGAQVLRECQFIATRSDGEQIINGSPAGPDNQLRQVSNMERIRGEAGDYRTGPLGPFGYLAAIGDPESIVRMWRSADLTIDGNGTDPTEVKIFYPELERGSKVMRPGLKFKVEGTPIERLDFLSLMLALFLGTAALPHILIRYYTVPSPKDARRSTIVAIAAIGAFYVLTLFMGLGAMTSGVVDLTDGNMSAPLLARSFGAVLFSMISSIAFATVLGTVSGLIIAASGAVAHDLLDRFAGVVKTDKQKVVIGKIVAFTVGFAAIILGIIFKGTNVSFLVGLAFAVAASANLPSIVMMLFWKRTTAKGITASIFTGIVSSIGLILLSPTMYEQYGLNPADALVPLRNPGVISIPLSFVVIVVVSLLTQKGATRVATAEE